MSYFFYCSGTYIMKSSLSVKQLFCVIFLALVSAVAILYPVVLARDGENIIQSLLSAFQTDSHIAAVVSVGLFLFYKRTFFSQTLKSPGVYGVILSVLFSCFTVFGESFAVLGSWNFILGGKIRSVIGFVSLAGYFILYYSVLKHLFFLTESPVSPVKVNTKFSEWVSAHFFLFAFLVISLAWLPYLIISLPGNCPYDGYCQISMAVGSYPLQDNHPFASTVLLGSVFSLGRRISDNFGVFLTVFLQYIICAAVYSFVCKRIRRMCGLSWISYGAVAFYAFIPMWGMYTASLIKDTLSYAFFTLFALSAMQMIRHRKDPCFKDFLFFFCTGLFMTLIRHHFLYIVLPVAVSLVFVLKKKDKLKMVMIALSVFAVFQCYSHCLLPALGVASSNPRETKTIIFQQAARYVRDCEDELTPAGKRIIDKVLNYEKIKSNYNPELSDPVKGTFRTEVTRQEYAEFINLWLHMLIKHPGLCLQATMENSFGYFYPFYVQTNLSSYPSYIKGGFKVENDPLNISYVFSDDIRSNLSSYAKLMQYFPGLSLLSNPGFYAWVLLFLTAVILRKRRWTALPAFLAPLLYLLGCIGSPVNGLLRYAMVYIAPTPLLLAFCMQMLHDPSNELSKAAVGDENI